MVAFLCHFYGGMPNEWLDQPVRTFFALYREAIKMEARQYSELADLHLISNNMKIEYFIQKKEQYRAIIDPEVLKLPPRPSGPVFQSGSQEARDIMQEMARGMKRNLGYGRR